MTLPCLGFRVTSFFLIDTADKEIPSTRIYYFIYYILFYVGTLQLVLTGGRALPCI